MISTLGLLMALAQVGKEVAAVGVIMVVRAGRRLVPTEGLNVRPVDLKGPPLDVAIRDETAHDLLEQRGHLLVLAVSGQAQDPP